MKKTKNQKGVQRFFFLCSVFIMAILFTLTTPNEAKAGGGEFSQYSPQLLTKASNSNAPHNKTKKHSQCSLKSVTIEIDGKEYICDGSLNSIPVDQNTDWKDFIKKIKITDYKVLVNDCCSHVEGHDSITAHLFWGVEEDWNMPTFCIYEEDENGGKNTYQNVEGELDASSYQVLFCLDGDINSSLNIFLSRECTLSYELNGGSFPEGMEVPDTCMQYDRIRLPIPVNSDKQFLGWTKKGQDNSDYITWYSWNGVAAAQTFVANWSDTAPIDLSDATISTDSEYPYAKG